MSIYLDKRKGWRYDFTLNGRRYTQTPFKTKAAAKRAEAQRREEVLNPPDPGATPTDMDFLELVNWRLDYVKAYKSASYFQEHVYLGRRLLKSWQGLNCRAITPRMVQTYLMRRGQDSAWVANKDLRYLRSMFNFGIKLGLIAANPTRGLEFLPVERRIKYVPPKEDVAKVLLAADPETQDYLVAILDTLGRVGEINRLTWEDVDFRERTVVLYTRKKRGGHLTPRKVAMTTRLYNLLQKRWRCRDPQKPWVFWHRSWSRKEGRFVEGPYRDRKDLMANLCRQAGVKYFRFHALRHFGASVLDRLCVPLGAIQRILGHESRTTTEIYLHSIGEAEREAMALYEAVWQEVSQESLTQILTRRRRGVRPLDLTP